VKELAFAALGAVAVFLAVVPLVTLPAKALLVLRRRRDASLPAFGTGVTLLLITGPALGAATWFVSAGLHQFEPGGAVASCLAEHLGDEGCVGALAFALCVATLTLTAVVQRLARASVAAATPVRDERARRLASLCAAHPRLRALGGRVRLVAGSPDPIRTCGLLRPRVEVDAGLAARLDDRALTAALLHEAAHAEGRDPLRQLLASASFTLNPLAFLLRPELRRWRLAREAACDRAAVAMGADPLSLAEAIVAAARPGAPPLAATLGGGGPGAIDVRVRLLLDYSRHPPGAHAREWPLAGVALVALSAMPHALGAGLLDALHRGIDAALSTLVHL
jgi:beta-lactamase regulating signal transducer with metallopeptidase domain